MAKQRFPNSPVGTDPCPILFTASSSSGRWIFLLALVLLVPGVILMLPLALWVKLDSPLPGHLQAVLGGTKTSLY
jgi:hypothetical protein